MGNYFGKLCYLVNCTMVGYNLACRWQTSLVEKLKTNDGGIGYLLLLEHPPVITVGRAGSPTNILASSSLLRECGVELAFTTRGGDVTYHGPGQLVGYPILKLPGWGRSVHGYLRRLEELLIRALASYDIDAGRKPGYTGVWVGGKKVAAIGVAFSRWVASHGFALNVDPDMSHFHLIHPCGIRDAEVTSIRALLGRPVKMTEVRQRIVKSFEEVFPFQEFCEVIPEDGSVKELLPKDEKPH